jgi:lipopolysaccharide transport system ATP-binding protein
MNKDNEVLVKVDRVSKKFCRDLKKSLWYGVKDVASELLPSPSNSTSNIQNSKFSPSLRDGEFWANKDISFELRRGECLGLVGHNGAGKTTLLKMLNGLIKPDTGSIEMRGRVGALIALGAGFNPILTGRENIYVNGSILGLTQREISEKIDDIIDFSEIGEFIDSPVQSYSSGMAVRLGFAVATAMNPDVLILDEVLAVGDGNFRSKCIRRIGNILADCAVIFVSHESYQIRRICDRILWLKHGEEQFIGDTTTGMDLYAKDLMRAEPHIRSLVNTTESISKLKFDAKFNSHTDKNGTEIGSVSIDLQFESVNAFELGMRIGNINVGGDTPVAQFTFGSCMPAIREGLNVFRFEIPQVQLSKGIYTIGLIVYDQTDKRLLLNLKNIYEFEFHENRRYGSHYALTAVAVR